MRILILTSCTGEKTVTDPRQLTFQDFRKGAEHVAAREGELAQLLTPAEELYTGQQHVRLMRSVRALRTSAAVDVSSFPRAMASFQAIASWPPTNALLREWLRVSCAASRKCSVFPTRFVHYSPSHFI